MTFDVPWLPLEDVVEDILDRRGVTPLKLGGQFVSTGHRVISAKLLKGGRVDLDADEPRYVDSAIYAKWMKGPLLPGDVLMTSEAPLGEVAIVSETLDWCLGQRLFAIRPKKQRLDGCFAYYALQTREVRDDLLGRSTGTTVQGIRQSELRRVRLPVPDMPFQVAAAAVLRALDDRIAALRETNATLEAIAQALFKSWFVDFDPVRAKSQGLAPAGMDELTAEVLPDGFEESAVGPVPKGWIPGVLGDVLQTVKSQLQPSDLHAAIHYVGLEHLPRKSLSLASWDSADGLESAKAQFKKGDVLFGKLRPYFHKVVLAPFDGVCSTDILVCRPKKDAYYGFSAMHLFSAELIRYADRLSNGAKMPRIGWADIAAYPVVVAPEVVAAVYNEAVRPVFEQMRRNVFRAATLATLRDTLLPRLLSGQLRLPETEEALTA